MYYTIKATDVGRLRISAFGRFWETSSFIGRIIPRDVGKRVYLRGDIVQVENDEQRDTRIARGVTWIVGQSFTRTWRG